MSRISILKHIKDILRIIYSKEEAHELSASLKTLMDAYGESEVIVEKRRKYNNHVVLNEKDAILITYPDTIYSTDEKPLSTLHRFLRKHVRDAVTGVHIVSFFPSSSDGGYAVINYKEVDPRFGTWEHIREIAQDYRLMVDLVMNHVSSKSSWFKGFLEGDKRYRDYFIVSDNKTEMPEVFRPRETPLFTGFNTAMGKKYVWTTFSADQVDLNYKNPEVLLEIVDVFLFYLSQGAEIIRLDAVGYIWKEAHTRCVNLSKTHQIVKLLRRILEYVAPYALILTEANFPYKDNISYFGEGHEANMVYQFSLPPLVLDAFARHDTGHIQEETNKTRQDLLFFDFLASHDGIGLSGARGILDDKELLTLVEMAKAHGGLISYELKDGKEVPYELNISYFDAVNDPGQASDPLAVKRFIASQAVMLALKGVPGIYIHSLLGSRNYYRGVRETGIKRMINREKIPVDVIDRTLSDVRSLRHQVFSGYLHLLNVRKKISSFHPAGTREVLNIDKRLLTIVRQYRGKAVRVVINVSKDIIFLPEYQGNFDLISCKAFEGKVPPYGVFFLTTNIKDPSETGPCNKDIPNRSVSGLFEEKEIAV
ncbi:sucrose phosphorylase [bacterium BMS3Bbin07]|nr:sucrose phosphorylase [bacterium BMS3Bbin07]